MVWIRVVHNNKIDIYAFNNFLRNGIIRHIERICLEYLHISSDIATCRGWNSICIDIRVSSSENKNYSVKLMNKSLSAWLLQESFKESHTC